MENQTEDPKVYDSVDGVETEIKKKVEELLRYILTRFLSVSVNTVFKHCCQVSEASDQDKTDGEPLTHVELLTKYEDKLPAIFTACGRHIALHHLDITKKLFYYILPKLELPDGQLTGVNIDQIISKCIAEWFISSFQVAVVDLFPSEDVIQAVQETTPDIGELIRATFWAKYMESIVELANEERQWTNPKVLHRS